MSAHKQSGTNEPDQFWLEQPRSVKAFQRKLLGWYASNRRDLPWRRTGEPYRIWISEIMLQQTRVAAVIPHYERFLHRFPDVGKLARARESSILATWSGLGYYRRARALHAAAKIIVKRHGGMFPGTGEELSHLPGIGRYTSAAIASIAFGEPVAVADGNVQRVLQRMFGKPLSPNEVWDAAGRLVSHDHPGDFNQAMMELGATVCLPRGALCSICPVKRFCVSFERAPGKSHRTSACQTIVPTKARRKKTLRYVLDVQKGAIFLVKRPDSASIMPGMWELPEIRVLHGEPIRLRHSITTTDYEVLVIRGAVSRNLQGSWMKYNRVTSLPLTGLARKILGAANIIRAT